MLEERQIPNRIGVAVNIFFSHIFSLCLCALQHGGRSLSPGPSRRQRCSSRGQELSSWPNGRWRCRSSSSEIFSWCLAPRFCVCVTCAVRLIASAVCYQQLRSYTGNQCESILFIKNYFAASLMISHILDTMNLIDNTTNISLVLAVSRNS